MPSIQNSKIITAHRCLVFGFIELKETVSKKNCKQTQAVMIIKTSQNYTFETSSIAGMEKFVDRMTGREMKTVTFS